MRWFPEGGSSRLYVVGLIAFLIGLVAVMQLRTQSRAISVAVRSSAEQAQVISRLVEGNRALREEIASLETRLAEYRGSSAETQLNALVRDLNRFKIVNGLVEVVGPGVEVVIEGEITATDAQDLINELWKAGAEAAAVNDQRIILYNTPSRSDGGLVINNVQLTTPYVFQAIGDSTVLVSSLEQRGGYLSLLSFNYPGLRVTVNKIDRLTLPVYQGRYEFRYAQAAPS